ncbi:PucR family transcriptional regulator [Saccharopolyspora shandongensis]|uniref:PucR family transcriptional regulator n=1 Tax=Saccharopolyspora shandongensis TaxID=418495 RepID=UPI003429387D
MASDTRQQNPRLTLQQLIDEPSLQLSAIEPGDPSTVIRSAHSIEIENPARWLPPQSIMLTTGLRFVDRPADRKAQARLIDELIAADVAALLFGIGVKFLEVPRGLREAARQRNFPLLTVAASTPFLAIEDFVNRGVLSTETYLLQRTVWLQNELLHALSASDPVNALVIRLGTLSRGAAVLYEGTGHIVASTGHGPLRLIWEEIAAREPEPQRFAVGQWEVATRPFALRGSLFRLAIASRTSSVINDLGPDVLETAERVLAAANAARSLVISQAQAEAVRIISALRAGVTTSQIRQTWDRLRAFGFRVGDPIRVVIARPIGSPVEIDTARTTDSLLETAHAEGLPVVLSDEYRQEDPATRLVAVLADSPAARSWTDVLARTHVTGASGPLTDLAVTPQYFEEADTAWQVVSRRRDRGSAETIVRLDEVDFATWLLTRRDDARVSARLDHHFGSLIAAPDLVETVVVYLATDQDVKATAQKLFVHPNTVRYRLRNVEQLVGGPIAAAKIVANLYLAFQDEIVARVEPTVGNELSSE